MTQKLHVSLRGFFLFVSLFLLILECAAADFEVNGIAYEVTAANEVRVVSKSDQYSGDVRVPGQVDYDNRAYAVTGIGDNAFQACTELTSVMVPGSVKSIGKRAFFSCNALTSLTLSEGLTSIGDDAFFNCSKLTSLVLPESVTSIGDLAFILCSGLTSIEFPSRLTAIPFGVLSDCTGLLSVVIPEGVTRIGSAAFSGCSSLTSVMLPESVAEIGYAAFLECASLVSMTLPQGITVIRNNLFEKCLSLTSVEIPQSVGSIEKDAFYGCTRLASISFPAGVAEIGDSAFYGCSALTSVKVAATVPIPVPEVFNTYDPTLYVPRGAYEAYSQNADWGRFKNILEYDLSAIPEISYDEQDFTLVATERGSLTLFTAQPRSVVLRDAGGATLMRIQLDEGANRVDGLAPGLYFAGSRKVIVQ